MAETNQTTSNTTSKTTTKTPDPMEIWSAILDSTISTDAYAQAMGKYLEGYLTLQEALRQGGSKVTENSPFPSREDLTRLAAQVVALESKIDLIDDRLAEVAQGLNELIELVRRPEIVERLAQASNQTE